MTTDFTTWKRENLENIARDLNAKCKEQKLELEKLYLHMVGHRSGCAFCSLATKDVVCPPPIIRPCSCDYEFEGNHATLCARIVDLKLRRESSR